MTPVEIKQLRLAANLTTYDLAAILGVVAGAVRAWERGDRIPNPRNRRRLAATLGLRTPDGFCPIRPTGCGCRCHGRRPRDEMTVLTTRRRTA